MAERQHMTETDLQNTIIDMCAVLGLLIHHCRPARTAKGWATPLVGNPGFPDCVIVGVGGVLYRELKTAKGKPSSDQREWLHVLDAIGEDTAIWRPVDLHDGTILEQLTACAGGPKSRR